MSAMEFTETFELDRVFDASAEKVFDAWTKADVLAQWFGPEGFEVVSAEIDCKAEGNYAITISSPEKDTIKHFGKFIEVDRPNKLIFTWVLQDQSCQGSAGQSANTLVELNFKQLRSAHKKEQTLLQLKHEKLPDRTALDGHRFGWLSSFESLCDLLNR